METETIMETEYSTSSKGWPQKEKKVSSGI